VSRNIRSVQDQIEFLPPNDAAFGGSGGADFVGFDGVDDDVFGDDGPGSRWLPVLASIVVLGLLGAGVIAAAPWDDGATATPPTTTAPTSTTVPSPTTTERVLDVESAGPPGYVLNDPGPWHLAGAWTNGSGERPPEAYADDRFDLWTTPGATRTSGRWMAISTQQSRGSYEEVWPNGVRVAAGLDTGVVVSSDDGVTKLSFTASDETPFEIGGFGFELSDLLAVAATVHGADDNTISYGALTDGVLSGLTPGVSELVPYGGVGVYNLLAQPLSGVYYMGDDYDMSIDLQVSRPTQIDTAVYDFLMRPVTAMGVADQVALDTMARGGRPVRLMTVPESPGTLMASWMDEREAVTFSTYGVSVSTLIGLLPQARLTEPTEWADLVDRTNRGEINYDVPAVDQPAPTQIGVRADGSNSPYWNLQMTADPATISISADQTGWGGPLGDISSAPQVRHFSSKSITFVVGTAEWPNTARVMRVTLEGMPPVDVPMVQVGDSTVYAAGYAFAELLPDTVEFLDGDGNLVSG
jgi:hypothetical protein